MILSTPFVPFAANAPRGMIGGRLVVVKNDRFFRGPVAELPVDPKRALASTREFEYPETIVCFPRCREPVRPIVLPIVILPVLALTPPCLFRRFDRPKAVPTSAAPSSLSTGSSSSSDSASPAVRARTMSAAKEGMSARFPDEQSERSHLGSCHPARNRHLHLGRTLLSKNRSLDQQMRWVLIESVNSGRMASNAGSR